MSSLKQTTAALLAGFVLAGAPLVASGQSDNYLQSLLNTAQTQLISLAADVGILADLDTSPDPDYSLPGQTNDSPDTEKDSSYLTEAEFADERDDILNIVRENDENVRDADDTYSHPSDITLSGITATSSSFYNTQITNTLDVTATTTIADDLFFADVTDRQVGVGTTTPDYKLDVDGQLRANSVVSGGSSIAGNQTINGNLTVKDNTILGDDNTADTLTVNSRLLSDIVPKTDATYNIGSSTTRFQDGFFSSELNVDTLTLSGGAITDTSGSIDFAGTDLNTAGQVSTNELTATSASATNLTATNATTTNLTATNATTTNLVATDATTTNLVASDTETDTLTATTTETENLTVESNATTSGSQYIGGSLTPMVRLPLTTRSPPISLKVLCHILAPVVTFQKIIRTFFGTPTINSLGWAQARRTVDYM
jgi:hypothetical protein